MTDEEMARRAAVLAYGTFDATIGGQAYYNGYLAGLKAGRPQWHDLRKDPNDLPKGQINRYLFGYVKAYRSKKPMLISYNGEWFYNANTYNTEVKVIAWCEIPTFDKE